MQRVLAILGGTFDPVHYGHLRVAWEAADALDAEVRMMPANMPPHRPQPRASAAQRVEMLRLALAGQERIRVDVRELDRHGPSYTIDTLASLREEFGFSRPLVLLLGADAFAGLATWHRWRELFELAHVAVLTRPGHSAVPPRALREETAGREADDARALATCAAGLVARVPVTALEISATRVRALFECGREPRFLLPPAVLEFAREAGLYRPGGSI